MLRAINIEKIFHDGVRDDLHVLNDINFTLDRGETSAIIGSSGSGKTTLLNIMGGLDKPSSGQILLNDMDVHKLSEKKRCTVRNEHFGFIYQFHHLLPEFTALENVAMPLLINGQPVDQATKEATRVLQDVGLAKRIDHKPGELSGGERQRAAIARALVHRPDCILADR
jgi:lipoprotein-releasing system ATP-binding protein